MIRISELTQKTYMKCTYYIVKLLKNAVHCPMLGIDTIFELNQWEIHEFPVAVTAVANY